MSFDMDRLMRLADTDQAEFERERTRLVTEALDRSQNRASCVELQAQLDLDRARLGPDAFMQSLANQITENTERLEQLRQLAAGLVRKANTVQGAMIR